MPEIANQSDPRERIERRIEAYQRELDRVRNQRTFPYVYILVALPTMVIFIVLTVISEGLITMATGITGALFSSLLIACSYIVLFQPNRQELEGELQRRIKRLYRERAKVEAGQRAEREVAYALKWLPPEYISVHHLVLSAPSMDGEQQQIDHLVVGPNGVFHLETKSINGVLVISDKGEWSVTRLIQNRMVRDGIDSPLLQVQRHERVLRDILNKYFPKGDVPVTSVVVMAHPNTIIEGTDPRLHVIKRDRLNEFILGHRIVRPLSPTKIRRILLALIGMAVEDLSGLASEQETTPSPKAGAGE